MGGRSIGAVEKHVDVPPGVREGCCILQRPDADGDHIVGACRKLIGSTVSIGL